jgi:succinyl-diaminopimelate desuccinylase
VSGTDLLGAVAELVDIPSVSHAEQAVADLVESRVRAVPGLEVHRLGDNVVARTMLGRSQRVVLAGHIDTVPPNGNERARRDGDTLWGLGSADMKAGIAVMLELAATVPEPAVDVTYAFYACEEVDVAHNGLRHLFASRPELLAGDAAILGEPTGAVVEAGCQGTLRVAVRLAGERAHSARPWMGRNAIHRLAPVLERVAAYEGRRPVLDGCEYREALQAVAVRGGVANNVVPDEAVLTLNHRFAPDRGVDQAVDQVAAVVGAVDGLEVLDAAPGAPPALDHPLLAALLAGTGQPPRAKLGWTDVSFFAARGIPAANFGAGDPAVAHSAAERVGRDQLEHVHLSLRSLLERGVSPGA